MPISSQISWLVPLVLPFVIGLLAGLVVKRTISLIALGIALVAVLSATGYISMEVSDIYEKPMDFLPQVINTESGIKNILPYSSPAFLLGLALGLWKG